MLFKNTFRTLFILLISLNVQISFAQIDPIEDQPFPGEFDQNQGKPIQRF